MKKILTTVFLFFTILAPASGEDESGDREKWKSMSEYSAASYNRKDYKTAMRTDKIILENGDIRSQIIAVSSIIRMYENSEGVLRDQKKIQNYIKIKTNKELILKNILAKEKAEADKLKIKLAKEETKRKKNLIKKHGEKYAKRDDKWLRSQDYNDIYNYYMIHFYELNKDYGLKCPKKWTNYKATMSFNIIRKWGGC